MFFANIILLLCERGFFLNLMLQHGHQRSLMFIQISQVLQYECPDTYLDSCNFLIALYLLQTDLQGMK